MEKAAWSIPCVVRFRAVIPRYIRKLKEMLNQLLISCAVCAHMGEPRAWHRAASATSGPDVTGAGAGGSTLGTGSGWAARLAGR